MSLNNRGTNNKKNLFIFAGELSGDLHGSRLITAIREIHPAWHMEGVCGPSMRSCGVSGPLQMEDFEVMGFTDVLLNFPKLYRQFYFLRDHIIRNRFDCVILIDYPGFNLKLASALRKSGYAGKIIQYISPTVWAWGKHRIETMSATLDLLLTIYPFEKPHFEKSSLQVEYVGNPLREYLSMHKYRDEWKNEVKINARANNKKLIGLFPGSRKSEIKRHLPLMVQAAVQMHAAFPETIFGISQAGLEPIVLPKNVPDIFFVVPKQYTYELMRDSTAAMAKSGTVTLELALHHCPAAVVYHLSTLNRIYAKHVLKVSLPHYCIVNILAKDHIFPELIERKCSADSLCSYVKQLYRMSPERDKSLAGCQKITDLLNIENPSTMAAEAVAKLLC